MVIHEKAVDHDRKHEGAKNSTLERTILNTKVAGVAI
jgi:hypothetical protein